MPSVHAKSYKVDFVNENMPESKPIVLDSVLWDQFRKGSDAAFIQIYEQYFDRLFAYGMRLTLDEALTMDGIQEVFFDLKNLRDKLGTTGHIKFYLLKCLKRKLYKQKACWDQRRTDLSEWKGFDFEISHEQNLIDQQIKQEKMEGLNKAIAQLSPRKKEVIYYFFYESLSYSEISELMGLESDHSTRNLMYKALDFLRKIMR